MVVGDVLCGYSLGRFMPSHNAFLGYGGGEGANCYDAGVLISIISEEQTGPTSLAERSLDLQNTDEDGLIDIGRAPNGDLVRVKPRRSRGEGFLGSYSLSPAQPSRGIGIPSAGAGESHFLTERAPERLTKSEEPLISRPQTGKYNLEAKLPEKFVAQFWGQSLGPKPGQLLDRFSERLSALTFTTALRSLPGRRRVRLVFVFGAVGAFILILTHIGLGGDCANDVGTGIVAESVRQAEGQASLSSFGDLREADAAAYAIEQVHAGNIEFIDARSLGEQIIEARVVSTAGDVVLVEVSVGEGASKTIATLLLQKIETGWRTRDIFKEGV